MNALLLNDKVQQYLKQHEKTDLTRFILKGSPFKDLTVRDMAQQLEGLQKTKEKLPSWYGASKIYYSPKINLEQSSSELTARYKASIVQAQTVADLTGGFGVDTFFFAQKAKSVDYFEYNQDLASVSAHNFKRLGAKNITVNRGDALEILRKGGRNYDLVYIDPSRRDSTKKRVFLLEDCAPNIPENLDEIFARAQIIMIKTSPMLDIRAGIKALNNIAEIHIVALKNEVKELLFILDRKNKEKDFQLVTANINAEKIVVTRCPYHKALGAEITYSKPLNYLYEPNAALMKSGLFNWIGEAYYLQKLNANSQLYTSAKLIDFPGRCFEVKAVIPYSTKTISKTFGKRKANITTRNFKESVAALRSKFKIADGGDDYLFFTTDLEEQAVVLLCAKV